MAYCTQSDIEEKIELAELIAITDEDDTGLVDTDKVVRAIADADAEIDAYCGKRYKVPMEPVPAMLRKVSVAISIYNLFQGHSGAPEDREQDYKNAIAFLDRLAAGKVSLGVQPPPDPPDEGHTSGGPVASTRDKMFGEDTMETF